MSNNYVENDNGFFVKATLFKDDVNGRKWRAPFSETFYKGISRSFGKIPYIDLRDKTADEHKEYDNDKYIEDLQKQGLNDEQIIEKLHQAYSQPEVGKVGVVVDMYDVQKKATYGNILNTCALSMGMCEKSDPETAVLDFIIRIDDKDYQEKIKKGEVSITPSPSLYASYLDDNGVEVVNLNDFFDMIHVANATYPANGKEAKMKAFCEGSLGSCKKKMLNASLPIENINNTQTQDTIRMSENPQQANATPEPVAAVPNSGFNAEEFTKLLDNYNVPKEVVGKLESLTSTIETLKAANEKTTSELQKFKEAEEQRKLNERKALVSKHITLDTFKGNEEAFKNKIEWINKMKFSDEDLATYLAEAFPVKIESADAKKSETKDEPKKEAIYGSLGFSPDDILREQIAKQETGSEQPKKRTGNTWGSIIPLSISGS